ncbi:MAG: GDP-mannose 4,6-dehydratase [Syntrophales bacterium]
MSRLAGKKVLVSGASGFIGSHLVRLLLSEGAKVSVILRYGSIERNIRLSSCWDSLSIFEADIRNIESLLPLRTERFDFVFHLAAYNHVGNSFLHMGEAFDTNGRGTVNLLEAMQDYDRLVYVSTSEVYGYQESTPFVETMLPRPLSPYSVGKYAGELYSLMKQRQQGLPIVVVRPFNAFGPYQSTRAVIPELIVRCLQGLPVLTTEGRQTREFNYVTDLVQGMMRAALCEKAEGQIINLGTGRDIAIRDLANLIHKKSASRSDLKIGALPTRPNEIWKMSSDAGKAKEILDWQPTADFETGLDRTIAWFRRYMEVYHAADSTLLALCDDWLPWQHT